MKLDYKSIPDSEKPRERLLAYGVDSLSNEELLAIIIKSGNKNISVGEISLEVLSRIKSISDIKELSFNNLITIPGIGKAKALEILACIELGSRINNDYSINTNTKLDNPLFIVNYFYYLFKNKKQEEFYVIYLDNKKKYINKLLLFRGTINTSTIHPREIFKNAYLLSAHSIICIHNHPSNDVTPSKEDINVTRNIKEISSIHGIGFIDHIIVGRDNYFSFYENNYLNKK